MGGSQRVVVRILAAGSVSDQHLIYVVIGARYNGRWIFVRHRERETWEMPAGHIEPGESADRAAVRELFEEARVIDSALEHISDYSVEVGERTEFGRLYAAHVKKLDDDGLEHEIEEMAFMEDLPDRLTYPEVQTTLFQKLHEHFKSHG